MFYEIDPDLLKQVDYPLYKRWFRDSEIECDLLVWEESNQKITRFQFWHRDALLEWQAELGIKTGHVDRSSGVFHHYQSELYRLHDQLDREIVDFVSELIDSRKSERSVLNTVLQILNEITINNPPG